MRKSIFLSALASSLFLLSANASASDLQFVTINDSTSYIRINDPDTIASTLDIKVKYTLPVSGIKPANLIKLNDMLMSTADVNYDLNGYLTPSQAVEYDGGQWVPATPANSAELLKKVRNDELPYSSLWGEDAEISPLYHDAERLTMAASNYIYVGGAHGMYFSYCANYSLKEQKFVYLHDLLPGLNSKEGFEKYSKVMEPILTEIAKKVLTGDDGDSMMLVDTVPISTDFAFTDKGIELRYQPYDIAPWSAGLVSLPLTYSQLDEIVKAVR